MTEATHLFEGSPDARQAQDVDEPVTLFRPRYRALTEGEKRLHDNIKMAADNLAQLVGVLSPPVAQKFGIEIYTYMPNLLAQGLPRGKGYDEGNVTLAIRHIEDAVYRAIKALTS